MTGRLGNKKKVVELDLLGDARPLEEIIKTLSGKKTVKASALVVN